MRQNEQRALVVAGLVLVFSTLALASAPIWAACITSVLAILATVPLANSRRVLCGPRPLLVFLLIPLVATAAQILPLPAAIVRVVAPPSYELAKANAHAYGHSLPRFLSSTQDWPGTLVELAKLSGFFAFAYVSMRLSASSRGRSWLLIVIAVVGSVVAASTLGHRIVGASSLVGLYRPEIPYSYSIAPFLNPNHLAGYLAFVTPICLGLAMHRRSWLLASMAVVCAGTCLQAQSRAGTVSLFAGLSVAIVLAELLHRRQAEGRRFSPFVLPGIMLSVLGGMALLGTTAATELLAFDLQREQEAGKFLAWSSAPDLVVSSPWLGIGRGAFPYSFTQVQPPLSITFSHLENEYLQALVDWGVVAMVAMVVAIVALARHCIRGGRVDYLGIGGLAALGAIAVQSVMDFGLQLPGMAMPAIAVAATVVRGKCSVQTIAGHRAIVIKRLVIIVAGVLVCALAASSLGSTASEDLAANLELDTDFRGTSAEVLNAGSTLSKRHPSSYLVPARVAAQLWRNGDTRAFRVLARALYLHPTHVGVHFLASQMLAASQEPRQALAEYRLALMLPGPNKRQILTKLEEHFPDASDLVLAVPITISAANEYGRMFLAMKRPEVALALATRSLERGATDMKVYELGIQAATMAKLPQQAVKLAEEGDRIHANNHSLLNRLKALRSAGLPVVGLELYKSRRIATDPHELDLLVVGTELFLEIRDLASARQTIEFMLKRAGDSVKYRRIAHQYFASIEEQSGNRHQAQWHRERAHELNDR